MNKQFLHLPSRSLLFIPFIHNFGVKADPVALPAGIRLTIVYY